MVLIIALMASIAVSPGELGPPENWGTETPLISFDYSDGAYPENGLIFDSAGNLYGTPTAGGQS